MFFSDSSPLDLIYFYYIIVKRLNVYITFILLYLLYFKGLSHTGEPKSLYKNSYFSFSDAWQKLSDCYQTVKTINKYLDVLYYTVNGGTEFHCVR